MLQVGEPSFATFAVVSFFSCGVLGVLRFHLRDLGLVTSHSIRGRGMVAPVGLGQGQSGTIG